jgi:hypothetical protein
MKKNLDLAMLDPDADPFEVAAQYEADLKARIDDMNKARAAAAERSTGPRSEAGKAISSRNSLRHGLTAKHVLLPGDDPAEFDQLLADLTADRKPAGELELQLIAEIAASMWRLSRARRYETGHFNFTRQPFQGAAAKQFDLILRYAASIERQLNRAVVRLEQLQAARRKTESAQAAANAETATATNAHPSPAPEKAAEPAPLVMVAGRDNPLEMIDLYSDSQFVSSNGIDSEHRAERRASGAPQTHKSAA